MTGQCYKYISHREQRDDYLIRIKVNGTVVTKCARTIQDAVRIRNDLLKQYGLDKKLFLKVHKQAQALPVPKLAEAFDRYMEEAVNKRGLAPSTIYKYEEAKRLVNHILGKLRIDEIRQDIWQDTFSAIQSHRHLSHNYLKANVGRYRSMYDWYIKKGQLQENPIRNIELTKTPQERRKIFTVSEKNSFLREARLYDYQFFFMFNLLFESGMRRGELLALQWKDIEFGEKRLHVNKSIGKGIVNGEYQEFCGKTKTAASVRSIPLSDRTSFMLRIMYEKTSPKQDDFVFTLKNSWSKYPWVSLSRIDYVFALIRDKAGLDKGLSIHAIRHYVVSKLMMANVDIKTVQELGGWAKASTLLDIYAHSNEAAKRQALQTALFTR